MTFYYDVGKDNPNRYSKPFKKGILSNTIFKQKKLPLSIKILQVVRKINVCLGAV